MNYNKVYIPHIQKSAGIWLRQSLRNTEDVVSNYKILVDDNMLEDIGSSVIHLNQNMMVDNVEYDVRILQIRNPYKRLLSHYNYHIPTAVMSGHTDIQNIPSFKLYCETLRMSFEEKDALYPNTFYMGSIVYEGVIDVLDRMTDNNVTIDYILDTFDHIVILEDIDHLKETYESVLGVDIDWLPPQNVSTDVNKNYDVGFIEKLVLTDKDVEMINNMHIIDDEVALWDAVQERLKYES